MSRFSGTKGPGLSCTVANSPISRKFSEFSRGRTVTNSLDGERMMQHRKVQQNEQQSHPQQSSLAPARKAHLADRHVGSQVALLRVQSRMTQTELAKAVGISVQQLQKYESAKNRISASMLFEIATVFSIPVSRLFDGLPGNDGYPMQGQRPPDDHIAFAASTEGKRIHDGLLSLPPRVRRQVSSFLTGLSDELANSEKRKAGSPRLVTSDEGG
jgi:transcriptional regulator with XRE-family HTH domain